MSEKPSIKEVREFLVDVRKRLDIDSYRNCGAIASEFRNELYKEYPSIQAIVAEGSVSTYRRRGVGPEHAFLIIEPEYLEDATKQVIFDGALNQFSKENKDENGIYFDKENALYPLVVTKGKRNRSYENDIFYQIDRKT